jgi:hypothetical protein
MSQITSQEIFKIFASPDKSLPNGVKISRIWGRRVIRESDLEEVSINDLYQISSKEGGRNGRTFLIISEDGSFSTWSPKALRKSIQTWMENFWEAALNMTLKQLIPHVGSIQILISALRALDNVGAEIKSNRLNSLFGRI